MNGMRESADLVALKAVAWLAANDDLLPVFLGASGAGETDLRSGLEDPAFQGAVLDFILMDDRWVTAFCDAEGLAYDVPARVRMALPGGGEVHWT